MPGTGATLATAWVEILPSTKGLGASLSQQLVGPVGAAGNAAGASMSKGLSGAKGMLGNLIGSVGKFTLGAAAAGAASVAAGKGIQSALDGATTAAQDYGSQVVLIQRLTGATAAESSTWAAVLGRFNVEGRATALVIKSLSTEIANQGTNLKTVGVATQNADGTNRTSMAVLGDLAEAYKNAKDKTDILAVGSKALGRGFTALLPVLANGKKGIEDLAKAAQSNGLIFSNADIQAVKDYNAALKDNEDSVKGTTVQVGLATLPWETFKTRTIGGLLKNLHEVSPEMTTFGVNAAQTAAPLATFGGEALMAVAALKFLGLGETVVGVATMGLAAKFGALALSMAPVIGAAAVFAATFLRTDPITAYQQAVYGLEGGMKDLQNRVDTGATTWTDAKKALDDGAWSQLTLAQKTSIAAAATDEATTSTDNLTGSESDAALATSDLTAQWKAQVQTLSDGRNDHEQALSNIIAIDDAEQALATARKTKDPFKIAQAEMLLDDARKFGLQTVSGLTKAEARAAVKRGELTKAAATEMLKTGELTGSVGTYIAKILHIPKKAYTTVTVNVNDSQYHSWLASFASVSRSLNLHVYGSGVPKKGKATGGIVSEPGLYPLAEKRTEWVIDPLNANGPALIASAAQAAGMVAGSGGKVVSIVQNFNIPATIKTDMDIRVLGKKLADATTIELRAQGVFA